MPRNLRPYLWNFGMKRFLKRIIVNTPVVGTRVRQAYWDYLARQRKPETFDRSASYWERRYLAGGNSGVGSYGPFAEFKADVINKFVAEHGVRTVIEFGCGDGNQLALAKYANYAGFDVSGAAISRCRQLYRSDGTKSFRLNSEYAGERGDLALSLDVIYHLVENKVFEDYMRMLFGAAERYVIIYSSDTEDNRGNETTHVRHRNFTRWIRENIEGWQLAEHLPNRYPYRGDYRSGSFAEFYIYKKAE